MNHYKSKAARWLLAALGAAAFLFGAKLASAQGFGGGTRAHDHSSTSQGGSLGNVTATSMTVTGRFAVGGSTFIVQGGTAAVPSGRFDVGGSTLVTRSGRVGIGTVSPGTTLDVRNATEGGVYVRAGDSNDNSVYVENGAASQGLFLVRADGANYFGHSSSMLGVGGGSIPSATLHVLTADTLTRPSIKLRAASAVDHGFDWDHEQVSFGRLDLFGVVAEARTRLMSFSRGTGNSTTLWTPVTFASTLTVAGAAFDAQLLGINAAGKRFSFGVDSAGANYGLGFYAGSTLLGAWDETTGNFGIGTGAPNSTLDVSAATGGNFAGASIGILSTNANAVKNWAFGVGRADNWEDLIFYAADKAANPHTTGTPVLTLGGGTGNRVGIGTTLPLATLEVRGSTVATNALMIHGRPDQALAVSSGCSRAVPALSVDGAVVSTGSIVALTYRGGGAGAMLVFTSTTNGSAADPIGFITRSACPENTVCPVCVEGLLHVKCVNGLTVGNRPTFSATRGVASHLASVSINSAGEYLETQASGADGWCVALLGIGVP